MRKRLWGALITLAAGFLVSPAHSQLSRFTFPEPPSRVASGGSFLVRWEDQFHNGFDDGRVYSLTWYYATKADGSDRKRMTTVMRDDFRNGFRGNWRADGPLALDWILREEGRDGRPYISAPRDGEAFSRDAMPANVVVSALVRPQGVGGRFALGLRVQPDGRRCELRVSPEILSLGFPGAEKPVEIGRLLVPRGWYWYEVGLKSDNARSLEARIRVFDLSRKQVLFDVRPYNFNTGKGKGKTRDGFIGLMGPADFAEIYVDPWEARYADDSRNEFRWDTSRLPAGDYYVMVEISNGKGAPRTEVAPYQVQVRNGSPSDAD